MSNYRGAYRSRLHHPVLLRETVSDSVQSIAHLQLKVNVPGWFAEIEHRVVQVVLIFLLLEQAIDHIANLRERNHLVRRHSQSIRFLA